MKRVLVVCTTDSMIWHFLIPHIKDMEKNGYYVECASSITGDFYENLVKHYDIKMNEIPFERSPYSKKNIKAYKMLCQLIKREKIDLVFCHEPVGGAMGRLAGYKCKCKIIYMAHGFHFYDGAPRKNWLIYYPIEKFFAKLTDAIITINKEDFERAKTFRLKNDGKVYYVPGVGVDLSQYKLVENTRAIKRMELGLQDSDIALISVGELNKNKNNKVIIEALAILNNRNLHYFLCGVGDEEEKLKKIAKERNVFNQVHFLGYRTDVKELFKATDIFVMPSLREGLSRSIMEAMASGLPCIVSDIRGNVDLVTKNKGGFLCEADDSKEFAKAISALCTDAVLCEKMGQFNKMKIKEFDISVVEREIRSIYTEVL